MEQDNGENRMLVAGDRVTTLVEQAHDNRLRREVPVGTFGTIMTDLSDEYGFHYDIAWDNGMRGDSMAFVLARGERELIGPDTDGNYEPAAQCAIKITEGIR